MGGLWHSSHSPPLSRSRRLQSDAVDSANPKRRNDFWTSKIPIEQIRLEEIEEKERESSSRRRKKRRARAEVLTSGRRRLDAIPQPLIGESTSTPLPNSHDATIAFIIVSLLYLCCQIISNLVTFYFLCFLSSRLSKVASPSYLLTLTWQFQIVTRFLMLFPRLPCPAPRLETVR